MSLVDLPHLYERLAGSLALAIQRGTFRAGERLPSVRRLSEARGVSAATVVAAYQRLEEDGLVEARPKSGHFVRSSQAPTLLEPRVVKPAHAPIRPSVYTGIAALRTAMRDNRIVPLGAATLAPELLPLPALNRTLAALARDMAGSLGAAYDAPPGVVTLRHQVARRAASYGVILDEKEIVTTVGAAEALSLALRAVVRPGDTVVLESPTHFGLLELAEELGLNAVEVPMHPRTGMDLDALDAILRTGPVKAVLTVPNVSNPLGSIMPDENKERLVRVLARRDVPLIESDVYGDLAFDGSRPRPAKAYDRDGRVILCASVSKTLAPGYRVGWIVPGRFQERVERLKYAQTIATPSPLQMAVAEFLASHRYERHVRRLRERLFRQVSRMQEMVALTFPKDTRVSVPQGGFMLWVELPQGVDAMELQTSALAKGIAIAPGAIFSVRKQFSHCIRLSCGLPWSERLAEAMRTLGMLAHELVFRRRTG